MRKLLATLLVGAFCALGTTGHAAEPPPEPDPESESDPESAAVSLPAYRLDASIDVPLTLLPTAISAGWLFSDQFAPAHCAPLCPRSEVNAFDRVVAGNWDPNWALAADIGLVTILTGATVTLLADDPEHFWNDFLVVIESLMWTNAVVFITKAAVRRPRPFLYSEEAPLSTRNQARSAFSFVSGHVALSAAATTATVYTLYRRGNHTAAWVVLGLGAGLSTLVAAGRAQSGKHFPTDIIAGAAIGASLGLLLPALHDAPVSLSPSVGPDSAGLSLSGAL